MVSGIYTNRPVCPTLCVCPSIYSSSRLLTKYWLFCVANFSYSFATTSMPTKVYRYSDRPLELRMTPFSTISSLAFKGYRLLLKKKKKKLNILFLSKRLLGFKSYSVTALVIIIIIIII